MINRGGGTTSFAGMVFLSDLLKVSFKPKKLPPPLFQQLLIGHAKLKGYHMMRGWTFKTEG